MISKKKWARKTRTFRQKMGLYPSRSIAAIESTKSISKRELVEKETHRQSKAENRKKGVLRCSPFLSPVYDNTDAIKPNDKILLTMGKNETARIPYFLEYYRKLGIDHFFFIDNDSDFPMADQLEGMGDVSLWHTEDPYPKSHFGVDWMNAINGKYAVGHWVLVVDLDEFFVFPNIEDRSFSEFIDYLDNVGQLSVFAPLIDMYPNGPISNAEITIGQSPLDSASWFDGAGYSTWIGPHNEIYIKGGPRFHHFNPNDISSAPTLNKSPLIKWSEDVLCIESTHELYPTKLNRLNPDEHLAVTGCLLHFKFMSDMKEKAKYAKEHKNHYDKSREYNIYMEHLENNDNLNLTNKFTIEYTSSHSLVDVGLMKKGYWA